VNVVFHALPIGIFELVQKRINCAHHCEVLLLYSSRLPDKLDALGKFLGLPFAAASKPLRHQLLTLRDKTATIAENAKLALIDLVLRHPPFHLAPAP
jgi:hypothetical protein